MYQPSAHHRAVASLLVAITFSAAIVTVSRAEDISACTLSAWSTDTDTNGLNVRSDAKRDAPIIGQLPLGQDFAAEVSITGSMNGWFRIDKAVMDDYEAIEPKVIFSGEGWVFGGKLGLLLNHSYLYAEPSIESPTLAKLIGEDAEGGAAGPDSFMVDRLLTCQGSWVEVTGTFLGTPMRGWAINTCASQVTTCP